MRWPRSPWGCCSGSSGRGSARQRRRSPASSTASSPSRWCEGVLFVNDSQGTQPDAVIAALRAFRPPVVLIAGGRDKDVDLSALGPVVADRAVAAVLIGESGPDLERRFREAGLEQTERAATLDEAVTRADAIARAALDAAAPGATTATVLLSPAAASFDMFPDYAARGRAFKDAVADSDRRPSPEGPMNLAPPIPRFGRPIGEEETRERKRTSETRRAANRTPTKDLTNALQRERHAPDYMILVVVVALAAVGILMVYSSSAMRGYLSAEADTFQTVGPQIQWALLGLLAMVAMMRVDYRYLRLISIPGYVLALGLLVLVFVDEYNIVVGGSARWLRLGPLPAIHPAEMAKLALVVYLAHWFAKRGTKVGGFWGGTIPFLLISVPVIALVFKEPDLGTTIVITLTAFTMCFVAGANTFHLGSMVGVAGMAALVVGLAGYQMDRIRAWLDPWKYADTASATTRSRACSRSGSVACSGPGSARAAWPAACSSPTRSTTSSSRSSARSSDWSARASSSRCSSCWPTLASAWRSERPTRSGRSWRRGSRPGCASRRSSTSGSS